jgi:hypothetical protein
MNCVSKRERVVYPLHCTVYELKTCEAMYKIFSKMKAVLRIRDDYPDPDFYPSRIPDPKPATKERGEKQLVVIPFYIATNFKKL